MHLTSFCQIMFFRHTIRKIRICYKKLNSNFKINFSIEKILSSILTLCNWFCAVLYIILPLHHHLYVVPVSLLHQSTHSAWWSHSYPLVPNLPHAYVLVKYESCWDVMLAWKGHLTQGCYEQNNSGQLDANRSGRSPWLWTTSKQDGIKVNLLLTTFPVAVAANGIHIWELNYLLPSLEQANLNIWPK